MYQAAVDPAFRRVAAANPLDNALRRHLLARVFDVHHRSRDAKRRTHDHSVIEVDVQRSRLVMNAPTHLTDGVYSSLDAGSNRQNQPLIANHGLSEHGVDRVTRLRTVGRNRSAETNPERLSSSKAIAAERQRRAKDYC